MFDKLRKRYVKLTPEEWVRQHFVNYLVDFLGYPQGFLSMETGIFVNGMRRRCDVVAYDSAARPLLLVELKAPHVPITQEVFDQAAVYNTRLQVRFFMLSNGLEHYCCRMDVENGRYQFVPKLLSYSELLAMS